MSVSGSKTGPRGPGFSSTVNTGGGEDPSSQGDTMLCRSNQFHRFFTLIALRPGRESAIVVHLFPLSEWLRMSSESSSFDQCFFVTSGASCPIQRSRHCFPVRPGTNEQIRIQDSVPNFSTALRSLVSSSVDHLLFRIALLGDIITHPLMLQLYLATECFLYQRIGNFVLNFLTKDRHCKYFSECSRSSSEYLTITYDNVVCVRKSLSAHTFWNVTLYDYFYDS